MKDELLTRLERQRAFFTDRQGHFLVLASYTEDRSTFDSPIGDMPASLSEAFLAQHAFDLGIHHIRACIAQMSDLLETGDDSCAPMWASPTIDWGTGATAALFTGGRLVFEEMTSYTAEPVVRTWDDIDKVGFQTDSPLVQYELDTWRGISSEYVPGIPVTPHNFRSPLDLANDCRGNGLFTDLYDNTDRVHELLDRCTESIIEAYDFFRAEIPLLREAPGGAWGIGLPDTGMLFLNGDPVDLISIDMGETFNHPYVARLADHADALYFHHHSIGIDRAGSIGKIKGLTVQEVLQDPNGPRIEDCIDEALIAASLKTPIDLTVNLAEFGDALDDALARLRQGRFILHLQTKTLDECRKLIERIKTAGER